MGDIALALSGIAPTGDTKIKDDLYAGLNRHFMVPISKDDAAADTYDLALFQAQADITLTALRLVPGAALTADDTNYATLTPNKGNAAAGALTGVATAKTTKITGGTGNWAARTAIAFTLNTDGTQKLTKGQYFYISKTVAGTGVALAYGMWLVEYTYD